MDNNSTEILEVPDKFQQRAHVLCHALYMCQFMQKNLTISLENCVYQAESETFPPFTL